MQNYVVPYFTKGSKNQLEEERRKQEEEREKLKKEVADNVQSQTKEMKDMFQTFLQKQQEQMEQQVQLQQQQLSQLQQQRQNESTKSSATKTHQFSQSSDAEKDIKIQELQAQISKLRTMMLDQQSFNKGNSSNPSSGVGNTTQPVLPAWQTDPQKNPFSFEKRVTNVTPVATTTTNSSTEISNNQIPQSPSIQMHQSNAQLSLSTPQSPAQAQPTQSLPQTPAQPPTQPILNSVTPSQPNSLSYAAPPNGKKKHEWIFVP